MNNILSIQNEQKQLERLSAQRELYSSAKRWYVFQILGSVLIPVTLAIISFFNFKLPVFAAIFSIVFFLVDLIFISPLISKRKAKAAKIQELFDCEVLQISKSPLKMSNDIAVEEVLGHYEVHNKIKLNIEKVRDWYPPELESINIAFARLVCQRTNCWWDAKLRSRYMTTVRAISIIIPLLILIIGIMLGMTTDNIVLMTSSLMPLFRFANKEYSDHKWANERLERTYNYILKLWENILKNCFDRNKLAIESRAIQDEIFENRTKSPFILDVIYNAFRTKNEFIMKKTASVLVQEIHSAKVDFDSDLNK